MSTSNSFIKIFIFPKITPWGVVRKADGTLEYKHVLRFETDDLRDEFINENLYDEIGDYRTDLANSPGRRVDFMSDTRIHFRYEASQNFNQIRTSDFCAVEIDGEIQFYALKVLKTEAKVIFFEGEIDLFFTYQINFREESENYVERAHLNRLTPDGSKFKNPTITEFPELLLAKEPFEPVLNQQENFNLVSETPKEWKWLIIYMKGAQQDFAGAGATSWGYFQHIFEGTKVFENYLPYAIYFIPIVLSGARNKKSIFLRDPNGARWPLWPQEHIYDLLRDEPRVIKIYITSTPPVNFRPDLFPITWNPSLNEWVIHPPLAPPPGFQDSFYFNKNIYEKAIPGLKKYVIGAFTITSLQNIPVTGDEPQRDFRIDYNFDFPEKNVDPRLLTSQFYRVFLKNYWQDYKTYNRELISQPKIIGMSSMSLENPKNVFYIPENGKKNLLSNNFLEDTFTSELPLSLDLQSDYLLKNKNQIQTQKQISRQNRDMSILGGLLKVGVGIGALAAAPATGGTSLLASAGGAGAIGAGALGIGGNILTHHHTLQKIESGLADLREQPQPVRVTGNDYYDIFGLPQDYFFLTVGALTPDTEQLKQFSNFLNMYGYQLNHLFNLNNLLANRKYWNYIVAKDVFNSLQNRVSSPQKQIISNAFSAGITFWHYRNREDWQGVLSYGRQNWETNYNFPPKNRAKKLSAPKKSKSSKTTKVFENFDEKR